MIYQSIQQMKKILGQLDTWLTKTQEFATKKSFEADTLLSFRLAPDQFPFVRQVQTACDTAKLAAARLSGKEAPKHADDEKTFAELHARVQSTLSWLAGLTAADFAGADKRTITTPRWEGKVMTGEDYLLSHATPNFYFHATHTFAILRHNGVEVGKMDYLGKLPLRDA